MAVKTNNGKKGGLLVGKSHKEGGIKAVVADNGKPIEVEGGEVIINKRSAQMYKAELSKINQAGGGVPIMAKGGEIEKTKITPKNKKLKSSMKAILKAMHEGKLFDLDGNKITDRSGAAAAALTCNYTIEGKKKKFGVGGNVDNDTLLAPNGKPSNLAPAQYKLVRTPEFKAWFGDWENDSENASKVLDENGEPLVVYHASKNKQFSIFEKRKGKSTSLAGVEEITRSGFFFANKKEITSEYADGYFIEAFLNIRKMFDISDGGLEQKELYKKIVGRNWSDDLSFGLYTSWEYFEGDEFDITDSLKNNNYDGAKLAEKSPDSSTNFDSYVAFNSNQIKLADGSNTTFDLKNPDIRFEDGGNVPAEPIIINEIKETDNKENMDYLESLKQAYTEVVGNEEPIQSEEKTEFKEGGEIEPLSDNVSDSIEQVQVLCMDLGIDTSEIIIDEIDEQQVVIVPLPEDVTIDMMAKALNDSFLEYNSLSYENAGKVLHIYFDKPTKFANGGEISPNKEVSVSVQASIKDLIDSDKWDLKPMEAGMLWNMFKEYETLIPTTREQNFNVDSLPQAEVSDSEKMKMVSVESLAEKGYVEDWASYADTVLLTEKGKLFIDAIRARQNTRLAVKKGYDMFPEHSGIKEIEDKIKNRLEAPAINKDLTFIYMPYNAPYDVEEISLDKIVLKKRPAFNNEYSTPVESTWDEILNRVNDGLIEVRKGDKTYTYAEFYIAVENYLKDHKHDHKIKHLQGVLSEEAESRDVAHAKNFEADHESHKKESIKAKHSEAIEGIRKKRNEVKSRVNVKEEIIEPIIEQVNDDQSQLELENENELALLELELGDEENKDEPIISEWMPKFKAIAEKAIKNKKLNTIQQKAEKFVEETRKIDGVPSLVSKHFIDVYGSEEGSTPESASENYIKELMNESQSVQSEDVDLNDEKGSDKKEAIVQKFTELLSNNIQSKVFTEINIRKLIQLIDDKNYKELERLLWSGNINYKNLFFEYTGIKLPKTDKGTREILKDFTGYKDEVSSEVKEVKVKMDKETILSNARKLKNEKVLNVKVNYSQYGIITKREFIEKVLSSGGNLEVAMVAPIKEVSRTRYNRMNWSEQKEYEKKLEGEKKPEYRIFAPNERSFWTISKTEYDYGQDFLKSMK